MTFFLKGSKKKIDLLNRSNNQNYNSFNYDLYDLNSKLVLKGTSNVNEKIMVSNLINGIYILNISVGDKVESHRLIIRS